MRAQIRPLLACMFLLAASAAAADSFDEGKAAYKAGNFAQAVTKLEQAAKEKPGEAKVWWQLNFAYNKLNRSAEALSAAKKAAELDPSLSFASSREKFQETLSRLEARAGSRTASPSQPPTGSTRQGSGRGNITQQLMTSDVYVQPGMRVDVARLQRTANELRPTVVKFAVFNSNSNSRTLKNEADRIRNYLKSYINNGEGYVIASSRRGVAVSSSSINKNTLKELTDQIAPQMEAGRYTDGLEALARGLVRVSAPRTSAAPAGGAGRVGQVPIPTPRPNNTGTVLGIIFVAILGVIAFVWFRKAAAANKAKQALKSRLERQKADVVQSLNTLDDLASTADPSVAARVRDVRLSAGNKLDQAAKILASNSPLMEMRRAETLLDQAQSEISRARSLAISGPSAAGGSRSSSAPPVYPEKRTSSNQTDWSAVADTEKGVCFFCSRPTYLDELTPVTVNLDGRSQKVLACADDFATVKSGRVPNIRAFNQGGRYVPWYAYDGYDPYRDYYGRYGLADFATDMIVLSAINNMYWGWHHPVGWGWGHGCNYAFYHDHPYYHDYYVHHSAGYGDFDRDSSTDAGGTDFLQGSDGDSGGDFGSNFGGDVS
jgi:tetratricopeptide (TPR) repeat protein